MATAPARPLADEERSPLAAVLDVLGRRRAAAHPHRLALLRRGPDPGRDRRAARRSAASRSCATCRSAGRPGSSRSRSTAGSPPASPWSARSSGASPCGRPWSCRRPHDAAPPAGDPGRRAGLLALRPARAPARRSASAGAARCTGACARCAAASCPGSPWSRCWAASAAARRSTCTRPPRAWPRPWARSATTWPPRPSRARPSLRDMLLAQAGLVEVLERGAPGRHRRGQRRHARARRHQPPHRPARRRRTPPSSRRWARSATCSAPSSTPTGRPVDHPLNRLRRRPAGRATSPRVPAARPGLGRRREGPDHPRRPGRRLRQPPDHRRGHGRGAGGVAEGSSRCAPKVEHPDAPGSGDARGTAPARGSPPAVDRPPAGERFAKYRRYSDRARPRGVRDPRPADIAKPRRPC